ncbi:MAG TPA: type II toxin-antitoxin system RelE/ParE family toxin [Opitutaceae bacterium]|nr:type II toxin-antitoxin system RelE/ParE family toxin [Opitutaceae bacterium]HRJ48234.1 type II toxin-antitoxin system RelE/ParE family toxin [Opitutaceae bacterium]
MIWLLLVRPQAERDLESARDWYDEKRGGLGDEFLDEVAFALRDLERDPQTSRLYYRNFRRVLLRRFPYKIFYQVIGERVVIFRVIHAKQNHASHLPDI